MKDITMEFVHVMTGLACVVLKRPCLKHGFLKGYYEGQASPFDINVAAWSLASAKVRSWKF